MWRLIGFPPQLELLLTGPIFSLRRQTKSKQMFGENVFQETNLITEIARGHVAEICRLSDQGSVKELVQQQTISQSC